MSELTRSNDANGISSHIQCWRAADLVGASLRPMEALRRRPDGVRPRCVARELVRRFLALACAIFCLLQAAIAQCTTQWLPGDGVPGTNDTIDATTMWDPDGAGPLPSVLVVGGTFRLAGNVLANLIAIYDPASGVWSALGTGMNNRVFALTTMPNGDLVAGGQFTTAGGVSANRIARWNGTSWSALGTGTNNVVWALATLPNGDLVAGGEFTTAGGVSASRIARWNGTSWSALGAGMAGTTSTRVQALTTLPNGDLVAGGVFTTAGGVSANYIARWNGTSWSALGAGMNTSVRALTTTLPNGDLVAGGQFTTAGGVSVNYIARWNGTSWSALSTGMNSQVATLTTLPNGDVVAGGNFTTAGGVSVNRVAIWNGTSWSALGTGMNSGFVEELTTLPNGDLVAAGGFTAAGGVAANRIARWDGVNWSALSAGTNSAVRALTTLPNGDLVAGGDFTTIGGVAANRIARWNGTIWSALGTGIDNSVLALTTLPNGDLVAGGNFTTVDGVAANRIARWNGTSWSALGTGTDSVVRALATLPNGDLVAGGDFTTVDGVAANRIARWDGSTWAPLGTGIGISTGDSVFALTTMPNGDIVAGGRFFSAGGVGVSHIARWNGSNWAPLGGGLDNSVFALTTMPNGDLVAGGQFGFAGGFQVQVSQIARWNGSNWSALGGLAFSNTGSFLALRVLTNGDLVAGGSFTQAGGVSANRIARWNGSTWAPLGTGIGTGFVDSVFALTTLPNGDLVAGGDFTTAGGLVSAYLARLTTTCPATATALGAGCTGNGGLNTLTANSLPWLGSSFQLRATGFPPNSFAFGLLGITPTSIPVVAVHPAGLPGCTLYTLGDVQTDFLFPSAGAANIGYSIPMDPFLVGLVAHAQMASVELDLSANITAITTTNEVQFTLGQF